MPTSALVGIDIGTSSAKGAAHDPEGRLLGSAEVAYRHETPRRGWAEADAAAWWRATCRILRALARTVRPARIDGVAVTGQAPTLLLVDAAGRPLILISRIAQHTHNLQKDPRCSLLVGERGAQDVQAAGRLTLLAEARPISEPAEVEEQRKGEAVQDVLSEVRRRFGGKALFPAGLGEADEG